jgi:hypothetical protein
MTVGSRASSFMPRLSRLWKTAGQAAVRRGRFSSMRKPGHDLRTLAELARGGSSRRRPGGTRNHRSDELRRRRAPGQAIGLGKQVSFEVRRAGVPIDDRGGVPERRGERSRPEEIQASDDHVHLRAREPLRHGKRMEEHPALDQRLQRPAR